MSHFSKPFLSFRSGFFCFVLLLAFSQSVYGQFKFREPPNRQEPDSLGESVGQDFWNWFLYNRAAGTFQIEGALTYRPPGKPSVRYQIAMTGDWQVDRQETFIVLLDDNGKSLVRHVILDGDHARVMNPAGEIILDEDMWDKPVIDEFPITWLDLLMPYLEWEAVTYLGPDRYLGRPAHRFSLANPEPDGLPAKVRVMLDADYAAVLKTELLDRHGDTVKRMRVGGIKKFDDNWMFSELIWENRLERSSIRLKVSSYKSSLN